jgi:murein tripeptide amidase MpaA
MVLFAVLMVGLGSSGALAETPPPRPEILVVKVFFKDTAERDLLALELAAMDMAPEDHASTLDGYLTVFTDREHYPLLAKRGLRAEIDEEATRLNNQPIQWNTGDTFYNGYRTVAEMEAFLDAKVAAFPTLAQKQDIGDSWCKTHAPCTLTSPSLSWNGYDLWVLRITNQAIPGPKPVFWYDSGIHSREIATPELAMNFIDWLLNGYSTNADARWLVDHHDIYVMPMLNPDGHRMVEAGGNNPYYQRKNADKDDGCTSWPPPQLPVPVEHVLGLLVGQPLQPDLPRAVGRV